MADLSEVSTRLPQNNLPDLRGTPIDPTIVGLSQGFHPEASVARGLPLVATPRNLVIDTAAPLSTPPLANETLSARSTDRGLQAPYSVIQRFLAPESTPDPEPAPGQPFPVKIDSDLAVRSHNAAQWFTPISPLVEATNQDGAIVPLFPQSGIPGTVAQPGTENSSSLPEATGVKPAPGITGSETVIQRFRDPEAPAIPPIASRFILSPPFASLQEPTQGAISSTPDLMPNAISYLGLPSIEDASTFVPEFVGRSFITQSAVHSILSAKQPARFFPEGLPPYQQPVQRLNLTPAVSNAIQSIRAFGFTANAQIPVSHRRPQAMVQSDGIPAAESINADHPNQFGDRYDQPFPFQGQVQRFNDASAISTTVKSFTTNAQTLFSDRRTQASIQPISIQSVSISAAESFDIDHPDHPSDRPDAPLAATTPTAFLNWKRIQPDEALQEIPSLLTPPLTPPVLSRLAATIGPGGNPLTQPITQPIFGRRSVFQSIPVKHTDASSVSVTGQLPSPVILSDKAAEWFPPIETNLSRFAGVFSQENLSAQPLEFSNQFVIQDGPLDPGAMAVVRALKPFSSIAGATDKGVGMVLPLSQSGVTTMTPVPGVENSSSLPLMPETIGVKPAPSLAQSKAVIQRFRDPEAPAIPPIASRSILSPPFASLQEPSQGAISSTLDLLPNAISYLGLLSIEDTSTFVPEFVGRSFITQSAVHPILSAKQPDRSFPEGLPPYQQPVQRLTLTPAVSNAIQSIRAFGFTANAQIPVGHRRPQAMVQSDGIPAAESIDADHPNQLGDRYDQPFPSVDLIASPDGENEQANNAVASPKPVIGQLSSPVVHSDQVTQWLTPTATNPGHFAGVVSQENLSVQPLIPTQRHLQELSQFPIRGSAALSNSAEQRISNPAIHRSEVMLNSRMDWDEVSIHPTLNSSPKPTPFVFDADRIGIAENQPLVPERLASEQPVLYGVNSATVQGKQESEFSSQEGESNDLKPGVSFLGLPPAPPFPDSTSPTPMPAAPKPTPPVPAQPDRPPPATRQPPPLPEPMLIIRPPRPSLSLDSYLNRRRGGNP